MCSIHNQYRIHTQYRIHPTLSTEYICTIRSIQNTYSQCVQYRIHIHNTSSIQNTTHSHNVPTLDLDDSKINTSCFKPFCDDVVSTCFNLFQRLFNRLGIYYYMPHIYIFFLIFHIHFPHAHTYLRTCTDVCRYTKTCA